MSDVVYSAAKGLNLARVAVALGANQYISDAAGNAAARWGPASPPAVFLKAAVTAGTSTHADWAGGLATSSLSDEFIAWTRPQSVVEQMAPAMKTVEFNTRVLIEDSESIVVSWIGEGYAKPLTYGSFSTAELPPYKLTAAVVVTKELLKMSTADVAVRSILAAALSQAQDEQFLSDSAAIGGVQPAGILNGVAPIASTGDAAADIAALFAAFGGNLASSFLVMHPSVGAAIGLQNSLADVGAKGGALGGVPVLTSRFAPADSSGTAIVLLDASQILFAAGPVDVTTLTHGSLQMLDNPTTNSSTATATSLVSMFQSNSAALRVERFISWQVVRPEAVAWVSGADYSST